MSVRKYDTGKSPVQLRQAPVTEDQSELKALIKYDCRFLAA
jgi:hypothetical protein